jgi:hypothetical protein
MPEDAGDVVNRCADVGEYDGPAEKRAELLLTVLFRLFRG